MDFYKRKKVLITGGCSFIGSHLAESLVHDGAELRIVDDLSSGRAYNIESIKNQVEFMKGDLRDPLIAESAIKGQEIVFHLANVHGGRGFIDTHPADICENFIIDGNVFRACQAYGVNQVCYVSSACSYPTTIQSNDASKRQRYLSEEMADPFTEGCAMADGEYGWAKLMGEMTLKAYSKQHGLKGVSCRLFTVYGPRENESHAVIAFIAKALAKQDPFEIWGSGQQDRNFTYVSDVVHGLKLSCAKIEDCRSVNIGTDEIIKIIDAAVMVCKLVGHTPSSYYFNMSRPEGVHARAASILNQQTWLGWTPTTSFSEGLSHTVNWYLNSHTQDEALRAIATRLLAR